MTTLRRSSGSGCRPRRTRRRAGFALETSAARPVLRHVIYRRRGRKHRIAATYRPDRRSAARSRRHSVPATPALDTFPRLLLHHAASPRRPSGHAREGSRHLADVDLGAGRGRGARAGLRTGGAGLQARDEPRDHRRQPAAALLGDGGGAGVGRGAGAALPGCGRDRDGLCAERCRGAFRDRRGPGASRQAARDPRSLPHARAHRFRRPARPSSLHAGFPARLRRHPGDGTRAPRGAPGLLRRTRWREGAPTMWP